MKLLYNLVNVLLGIYPREMNTYVYTKSLYVKVYKSFMSQGYPNV
jgi:hypothetical protein